MKFKATLCHDTPPRWFIDKLKANAKMTETRKRSVHYRALTGCRQSVTMYLSPTLKGLRALTFAFLTKKRGA